MNSAFEWATVVLGVILTMLGANYRADKKRNEDATRENRQDLATIDRRLSVVETELMTEREVRKVLKDYFDPFMHNMGDMQKDVQEIKVQLAQIPKRKEDP